MPTTDPHRTDIIAVADLGDGPTQETLWDGAVDTFGRVTSRDTYADEPGWAYEIEHDTATYRRYAAAITRELNATGWPF